MQSSLAKLESWLDERLNKKAPVQLPPDGRKSLAGALWWIALIVGILQLWGAWVLWSLGHTAQRTVDYLSQVYGASVNERIDLGLFYWFSLVCVAVVAVVMLLAAPKLKQMKKSGWDLLYYAMLLNALFAVLRLFSGVDGIFSGFLGAVVGTVIGAYLLFQTRDQFSGKHTAVSSHEGRTKK